MVRGSPIFSENPGRYNGEHGLRRLPTLYFPSQIFDVLSGCSRQTGQTDVLISQINQLPYCFSRTAIQPSRLLHVLHLIDRTSQANPPRAKAEPPSTNRPNEDC